MVFDAKDFGAKADGTTDDAPAIQRALDAAKAASGGIVFLPFSSAAYVINAKLKIPSNTTLLYDGPYTVTIKQKNSANLAAMLENDDTTNGNSNIAIQGILFDGNKANQSSGDGRGLSMAKVTDSQIINCRFTETFGWGVYATDLLRATFESPQWINNDVGAARITGTHVIINRPYSSGSASDGLNIQPIASTNSNSRYITIRDGIFTAAQGHGLTVNIDHGLIDNNRIYGNSLIASATQGGINYGASNDIRITRNVVFDHKGWGISNSSITPTDTSTGVNVVKQGQIYVHGNVVHDNGYGNTPTNQGFGGIFG